MRTSLRRAIALSGLTAVVVVSGSIAVADGTAVQDITGRALATAPEPTDLTQQDTDDDDLVGRGLDTATLDRLRAAGEVADAPAPRPVTTPDRGDRSAEEPGWIGRASWYGPGFHGNLTANGETYDQHAMTAAHKTLPFGTLVRVTRLDTFHSVVVEINDRGPFIEGRIIDLARRPARDMDLLIKGIAPCRVEVLHQPTS